MVGRHGHRDSTLILLAYWHGLRASEMVALRWHMVDYKAGLLHVRRRKNGTLSTIEAFVAKNDKFEFDRSMESFPYMEPQGVSAT